MSQSPFFFCLLPSRAYFIFCFIQTAFHLSHPRPEKTPVASLAPDRERKRRAGGKTNVVLCPKYQPAASCSKPADVSCFSMVRGRMHPQLPHGPRCPICVEVTPACSTRSARPSHSLLLFMSLQRCLSVGRPWASCFSAWLKYGVQCSVKMKQDVSPRRVANRHGKTRAKYSTGLRDFKWNWSKQDKVYLQPVALLFSRVALSLIRK